MTTFPKNNLPTGSLNWSREVEKAVNNLQSTFKSAEINNVTRDAQLQNSYKRLDTAITQLTLTTAAADEAQDKAIEALGKANEAIQDVIDLGAPGGPAINAFNITAGKLSADYISGGTIDGDLLNGETITGVTIQGGTLSTSGTRHVEITGTSAFFYDDNGDLSGSVSGNGSGTSSQLYIGSGVTGVSMYNGGLDLEANGLVQVTGGNGFYSAGLISGDSGLTISGGGASISGGLTVFNGANISGGLQVGTITSTGNSIFTNTTHADITTSGNVTVGSPSVNASLTRAFLNGGGTTGASFTNSGALVRTSSSRRYKTEIEPLDINLQDLYELEPKTFKRIEEVEEDPQNARTYPGFIAEELAGTSLDKFVFYGKDEDGNDRPEGVHYPELTAALLLAIKSLNSRIESLEDRVQ
jgi:hypothetical protein